MAEATCWVLAPASIAASTAPAVAPEDAASTTSTILVSVSAAMPAIACITVFVATSVVSAESLGLALLTAVDTIASATAAASSGLETSMPASSNS